MLKSVKFSLPKRAGRNPHKFNLKLSPIRDILSRNSSPGIMRIMLNATEKGWAKGAITDLLLLSTVLLRHNDMFRKDPLLKNKEYWDKAQFNFKVGQEEIHLFFKGDRLIAATYYEKLTSTYASIPPTFPSGCRVEKNMLLSLDERREANEREYSMLEYQAKGRNKPMFDFFDYSEKGEFNLTMEQQNNRISVYWQERREAVIKLFALGYREEAKNILCLILKSQPKYFPQEERNKTYSLFVELCQADNGEGMKKFFIDPGILEDMREQVFHSLLKINREEVKETVRIFMKIDSYSYIEDEKEKAFIQMEKRKYLHAYLLLCLEDNDIEGLMYFVRPNMVNSFARINYYYDLEVSFQLCEKLIKMGYVKEAIEGLGLLALPYHDHDNYRPAGWFVSERHAEIALSACKKLADLGEIKTTIARLETIITRLSEDRFNIIDKARELKQLILSSI